MQLENIKLQQFKNYPQLDCKFSPELNCLIGDNGSGKTNLLDAIFYLSFTKSAFNTVDQQNIMHDKSFFSIGGRFLSNHSDDQVTVALQTGQRKSVRVNKKDIGRTMDHIGRFPVVLVAPNDLYALLEKSEARRRFFDMLISQVDKEYLEKLIEYNKVLRQRNSLLKRLSEGLETEFELLEAYDHQLISAGSIIADKRMGHCEDFIPLLRHHFDWICDNREHVMMRYECAFPRQKSTESYAAARKKDLALQRTTIGVHRDDYRFEIEGYPLKKFGSQGQQKSYLIALKMAQFDILRNAKGFKPIVLMDDIFDKLDDHRIDRLVTMIEQHEFGQVFITDARPERTKFFVDKLKIDKKIFMVSGGSISETEL
jgi:DNA replication and repair protein RecF